MHSFDVARILFLAILRMMPHLSIIYLGLELFQALLDFRAWILWWEVLASNASVSALVSDITDGTDRLILAARIL